MSLHNNLIENSLNLFFSLLFYFHNFFLLMLSLMFFSMFSVQDLPVTALKGRQRHSIQAPEYVRSRLTSTTAINSLSSCEIRDTGAMIPDALVKARLNAIKNCMLDAKVSSTYRAEKHSRTEDR